nr:unnamed protein product [Callosobruchus analis]
MLSVVLSIIWLFVTASCGEIFEPGKEAHVELEKKAFFPAYPPYEEVVPEEQVIAVTPETVYRYTKDELPVVIKAPGFERRGESVAQNPGYSGVFVPEQTYKPQQQVTTHRPEQVTIHYHVTSHIPEHHESSPRPEHHYQSSHRPEYYHQSSHRPEYEHIPEHKVYHHAQHQDEHQHKGHEHREPLDKYPPKYFYKKDFKEKFMEAVKEKILELLKKKVEYKKEKKLHKIFHEDDHDHDHHGHHHHDKGDEFKKWVKALAVKVIFGAKEKGIDYLIYLNHLFHTPIHDI